MIRRLLPASLALFLAACGASGAPASAGPVSGGGGGGGSALPAGVTLPPGAVPTTSVPATIDSCTLLSDDEIKLATGEGVSERKPNGVDRLVIAGLRGCSTLRRGPHAHDCHAAAN